MKDLRSFEITGAVERRLILVQHDTFVRTFLYFELLSLICVDLSRFGATRARLRWFH